MKTKCIVTNNQPQKSSARFHRLMDTQIRKMYELKLLDAPAYILFIVQCHGAPGWKWTFTVKDFCREWGISKTTFYRAVSKLRDLDLLHWEVGDTITVWHGADIAKESSPTDETLSPTDETLSPTDGTVVPPMGLKTLENITGSSLKNASDLNQIFLDQTDTAAEEKKLIEEDASEVPEQTVVLESSTVAPLSPPLDDADAISQMRSLGIERNETVLALLKKHKGGNVMSAIAYIQQRGQREDIKNITGAFVDALKKSKKPVNALPSFGLHNQVNPPTADQLQALEDARNNRKIRDYFFSSIHNSHRVILVDGFTQMPWWEYLQSHQ